MKRQQEKKNNIEKERLSIFVEMSLNKQTKLEEEKWKQKKQL
jgi:hypothetical protein